MNLFSTSGWGAGTPQADTGALKDVMREVLELSEDHAIVIQELACTEPGCPPVETVLAVLAKGEPSRKWTIHAPLVDVTPDQIRSALTSGGHS